MMIAHGPAHDLTAFHALAVCLLQGFDSDFAFASDEDGKKVNAADDTVDMSDGDDSSATVDYTKSQAPASEVKVRDSSNVSLCVCVCGGFQHDPVLLLFCLG